jgi:cytochrome P450 family 110
MTSLPPGPRFGLPTLWRYLRDPYGSTLRMFERHGDPHTVRSLGRPMVMTGDPALIRAILSADPDGYEAWGVDLMAPAIGKESLILLSGERHRAARKLLMPPFQGARMRTYGASIQAIARAEAARWRPGQPFAMQQATQAISLRIILQAVFGITDPEASQRYERALVAAIAALSPSLLFIKALQHEYGGIGPWARLQRLTRAVETMVYAELAARRASPAPREDILSMVMAARYDDGTPMTDRQLFETLMTIVVAGHETSAIAIAWACYFVHRDPAVRDRLLDELATLPADADPDAITRLPYLEAVCHETLRLHPVAGGIARTLKRPMQLGAWELPAGVDVSPSIIGLHHRPELYPEPTRFRPERFLERSFGASEYLPFGGGHRRCIGAAFASYELKLVLATILRERPLRLVSDRPIGARPRSTVIGPARPIELVLA